MSETLWHLVLWGKRVSFLHRHHLRQYGMCLPLTGSHFILTAIPVHIRMGFVVLFPESGETGLALFTVLFAAAWRGT
jgi:hypothetical protein